jgi:hypothetical protein
MEKNKSLAGFEHAATQVEQISNLFALTTWLGLVKMGGKRTVMRGCTSVITRKAV